jgi:hypothetical protein
MSDDQMAVLLRRATRCQVDRMIVDLALMVGTSKRSDALNDLLLESLASAVTARARMQAEEAPHPFLN